MKRVCFIRKLQSCHPCSSYSGAMESSTTPRAEGRRIVFSARIQNSLSQGYAGALLPGSSRSRAVPGWGQRKGTPMQAVHERSCCKHGKCMKWLQGPILDRLQPSLLDSEAMIIFLILWGKSGSSERDQLAYWGDVSAWGSEFFTLVRWTEVCTSLMQPQMLDMPSLWNV